MLDSLELAWRLLGAFPVQRYLQLLPWHLTALLIVLGVLSSFGLQHLIGCVFRFYRTDGRRQTLLAALTLLLLLVSVQTLLAAYVVRTQPEALIRPVLAPDCTAGSPPKCVDGATDSLRERSDVAADSSRKRSDVAADSSRKRSENTPQPASVLGSILLAAPFSDRNLAEQSRVAKDRLAAAIVAVKDEDYRAALEPFVVPPDRLVLAPQAPEPASPAVAPPGQPASPAVAPSAQATLDWARQNILAKGGTEAQVREWAETHGVAYTQPARPPSLPVYTRPADLIGAIVVQIGLRWLLEPDQTWPKALPAVPGSAAAQTLRLPEFVLALIGEIQDGAALDRVDWERAAGTRFAQIVLQPVLTDSVRRWAGFVALAVLAANLAYFVAVARILGRMRRNAKSDTPG